MQPGTGSIVSLLRCEVKAWPKGGSEVFGRTPLPCRLALAASSVYCNVKCKPFSHGKQSAWSMYSAKNFTCQYQQKVLHYEQWQCTWQFPTSTTDKSSSRIIQQFISYIINMLVKSIGHWSYRIDMSSICPGKTCFGLTLSNLVFDIHSHKVSPLCHQQRVTHIHEAQYGFPEHSTNLEQIIRKSCKRNGRQVCKNVRLTGRLVDGSTSAAINMGWWKSTHKNMFMLQNAWTFWKGTSPTETGLIFLPTATQQTHIWTPGLIS